MKKKQNNTKHVYIQKTSVAAANRDHFRWSGSDSEWTCRPGSQMHIADFIWQSSLLLIIFSNIADLCFFFKSLFKIIQTEWTDPNLRSLKMFPTAQIVNIRHVWLPGPVSLCRNNIQTFNKLQTHKNVWKHLHNLHKFDRFFCTLQIKNKQT